MQTINVSEFKEKRIHIIDEANINFRQSRFEESFVKETSVEPAILSISCCHFDSQGEISCRNQRNFPLPGFHRAEFQKAGRAANMATGKDNIEPRPYLISEFNGSNPVAGEILKSGERIFCILPGTMAYLR